MSINYEMLGDQVANELRNGGRFHSAAAHVLRRNGIRDEWKKHFSELGKVLSRRKVLKRGGLFGQQIRLSR